MLGTASVFAWASFMIAACGGSAQADHVRVRRSLTSPREPRPRPGYRAQPSAQSVTIPSPSVAAARAAFGNSHPGGNLGNRDTGSLQTAHHGGLSEEVVMAGEEPSP